MRRTATAALVLAALALPWAGAASADAQRALPAAGTLVDGVVPVRDAPRGDAAVVARVREFRGDFRRRVVYVTAARSDDAGEAWLRVDLPGRPNGRRGWLRADAVDVRPVRRRLVIRLRARTIAVFEGPRRLLVAPVAIGAPATPTPRGTFYVTASFHAANPALGAWALETSARAAISEWPGGGIVGIHGTPRPELLGEAVSHGCVRVSDRTALQLRRLAPPGTTVQVRA